MTAELATLDNRALNTIREQLAPGASDNEIAWFGQVCQHLGLDPFRGQMVLIGRWDNRVGRNVYRPQVTVDGRRALAVRSGELTGIEGPWWTGPRNDRGELDWQELWDDPGPPYAARVFVYRFGWVKPANGTAKWDEFAQRNKDGKLTGLWATMPAHMLGKVAESMALRRAFPEVISEAVAVEFDAIDADGPEVVGGGQPVPERQLGQAPASTSPTDGHPLERSNDNEFIVPTKEQTDELRRLLHIHQLDGRTAADRANRLEAFASILGHPVTNTNEMSRDDVAHLIDAFAVVTMDHAATDDEEPY